MSNRRYSIPSTSALVAFECAARLCNFSRAAEELNTSQSAISRHISDLEARLSARLFEREKRQLYLTPQGEQFYRSVVNGLDNIRAGVLAVGDSSSAEQITIACTHEVSHFFLLPRFDALQSALGRNVQIRIMTYEYDALKTSFDPRIDVYFSYEALGNSQPHTLVLHEAVQPVCSPAFAESHITKLSQPVANWAELPFLQLGKHNDGWATWEDWFSEIGAVDFSPKFVRFDNYVYLLESATAGSGLALGWRGFIERYLAAGSLVTVVDGYTKFEQGLCAVLTSRGKQKTTAHRCLEFLAAQRMEIQV